MKCISLWQPWASLIAIGAKKIETRSWSTSYRGKIAIHAAKRWTAEERELCFHEPFYTVLKNHYGLWPDDAPGFEEVLPFGAIVATATLRDCLKYGTWVETLSEQECAFGHYAPGRYGWEFTQIEPLAQPISYRGSQGLFDIPDSLFQKGAGE